MFLKTRLGLIIVMLMAGVPFIFSHDMLMVRIAAGTFAICNIGNLFLMELEKVFNRRLQQANTGSTDPK